MLAENTRGRSQVQAYSYHEHPIEKSIYLSREGEQIPPPFSHNHPKHHSHSHLQPIGNSRAKPVTISQVNTRRQDSSIWDLFGCCREVTTVQ